MQFLSIVYYNIHSYIFGTLITVRDEDTRGRFLNIFETDDVISLFLRKVVDMRQNNGNCVSSVHIFVATQMRCVKTQNILYLFGSYEDLL